MIFITQKINKDAQRVESELRIAEAEAKKLIVEAEAQAKANELKQRTLTPLLVQQQWIEKWDGKSTQYGNTPQFFKQLN